MVRPRWSGPRASPAWNSADGAERGRGAECGGDLGLGKRIRSRINTLTTSFVDSCSEGVTCWEICWHCGFLGLYFNVAG